MIKRFLPLTLLFAWAPAALAAFPPCPASPVDILPLGALEKRSSNVEPWFQLRYAMAGQASITNQLSAVRGKCDLLVQVPQGLSSSGAILMSPQYQSPNGVGVISLPELPDVATDHLHLEYRLDFTIDNAPLARTGDWVDVAQMEFAHDRKQASNLSAVYRVRKIQRGNGPATVEVIESLDTGLSEQAMVDRIVAVIPLLGTLGTSKKTAIALRWTQLAQTPDQGDTKTLNVDSVLEVLGPDNGSEDTKQANAVMYSASLPRQWADKLSMGLLDYNSVRSDGQYPNNYQQKYHGYHLKIDNLWLAAKAL
jgi:hypothetical protein